jgi:hypothetical protein
MKQLPRRWYGLFLLVAFLPAGCGEEGFLISAPDMREDPAAILRQYSLPAEPPGGRGVMRVCDDAADGERVVVVGRVAGAAESPARVWAALTLIDLTWDSDRDATAGSLGCEPCEEGSQGMLLVKFVNEQGQVPRFDVPQLLGIKEGQTVVVRGEVRRDADGRRTVILANGLYQRP